MAGPWRPARRGRSWRCPRCSGCWPAEKPGLPREGWRRPVAGRWRLCAAVDAPMPGRRSDRRPGPRSPRLPYRSARRAVVDSEITSDLSDRFSGLPDDPHSPARNSWSNFLRFSDMTTPHSACLHGFGGGSVRWDSQTLPPLPCGPQPRAHTRPETVQDNTFTSHTHLSDPLTGTELITTARKTPAEHQPPRRGIDGARAAR